MATSAAVQRSDEARILSRAVTRAASGLGLSQKDVAATVGVSEATVSRLARGRGIDPTSKEGELAVLLVRLYRSLDAMVGGDEEQARRWMQAENYHLAGMPSSLVRSVTGLVRVIEYLDAMRGKS
ncbi:MAG: XRE family transcriptional regulator [bacterium]|nr:XRE family transcriptional regulator [bacterium]